MSGQAKYWCGDAPTVCQVCDQPITDTFIDGRTMWGCWACMCRECWEMKGEGLGDGLGQMYGRQADGRWRKAEPVLDPAEQAELERFDATR